MIIAFSLNKVNQKAKLEEDYERKIVANIENLTSLQMEFENLRDELFQKNIENQDLIAEKEAIKEVSDNKIKGITMLKTELTNLSNENDYLRQENFDLKDLVRYFVFTV